MMMKTFAAAFALAAGLALSSAPMAADVTLAQMHGKMWPKSTGFATKTQCLNCEDCHKANRPAKDVQFMCNDCHQFTLKKK